VKAPSKLALRDATIQALAGDADPNDARGVLRGALEQLSAELFMLGAAAGDEAAAKAAPIDPRLVYRALASARGRVEALCTFAEACLDVNFQALDEEQSGGAT
jgi:hypothetical protein